MEKLRVANPFLLRTVTPPVSSIEGKRVVELRRVGKRIAFGFEGELWLVLHLMIAGRLHWSELPTKPSPKRDLAVFRFSTGQLTLTEAGTKRRASLHLLLGAEALDALDPGGLEVLDATEAEFAARLTLRNHTLKRALTDPRLFSGIGNAFSDEILHHAGLSPVALSQKLKPVDIAKLFHSIREVLNLWTGRLREEAGGRFPEKVTAFRPQMAVHGKFGQPCPTCGTAVQRIRHADNETNYCPRCQTGGKLLADRALSQLLKKDWPKTVEELEELRRGDAR